MGCIIEGRSRAFPEVPSASTSYQWHAERLRTLRLTHFLHLNRACPHRHASTMEMACLYFERWISPVR
jgi:hypothetical protein